VVSRRASRNRPTVLDSRVISIPCHINGFHWVAVTRRVILGQVYFLYADDMNSPSSEHHVQQILANSHPSFYPPSSVWMRCNNYTFLPHSYVSAELDKNGLEQFFPTIPIQVLMVNNGPQILSLLCGCLLNRCGLIGIN
jgi:hypothetical protein